MTDRPLSALGYLSSGQPVVGLDDWTVQVRRELADLAGYPIGSDRGGPYVTLAVFKGADAEERARAVVDRMRPLMGDEIWAWSGAEIVAERRRRGGVR